MSFKVNQSYGNNGRIATTERNEEDISLFFYFSFQIYFIPYRFFPTLKHQCFLELINLQDWITLLFTKAFWWSVFSYFFFSSMNIFLKHAIPSYYWDSSLSQNKFLFYFLSVMPLLWILIFVILRKLSLCTIVLTVLFPSSVTCYFPMSTSKDAVTFKNPSKCQSFSSGFIL